MGELAMIQNQSMHDGDQDYNYDQQRRLDSEESKIDENPAQALSNLPDLDTLPVFKNKQNTSQD